MAIKVKRKNREIRDGGTVTAIFTSADVGTTVDFMGIPEGFRIVDVNVTVDTLFNGTDGTTNDNKISVGIEGDLVRFIPATSVDAVKGITFNNRQLTAVNSMAIVIDITGSGSVAATTGSATVTVSYAKLPASKQEY